MSLDKKDDIKSKLQYIVTTWRAFKPKKNQAKKIRMFETKALKAKRHCDKKRKNSRKAEGLKTNLKKLLWSLFKAAQLSVVKPKPKHLQWPITANTRNEHQARENAGGQVAIGNGFAFDWLNKWREFFKPITERSKQNQSNSAIAFDTQLKTALWNQACIINKGVHAFNWHEGR